MSLVKTFLEQEPELKKERDFENKAVANHLDRMTEKLSKYTFSDLCDPNAEILKIFKDSQTESRIGLKAFAIYLTELAILTSAGACWKEHPINLTYSILKRNYPDAEEGLVEFLVRGHSIEYLNIFLSVATAKPLSKLNSRFASL